MMDELEEKMKTATEEEKNMMARFSSTPSSNDRGSFSHDQVRQMVEDPVKTILRPMISAEAPLLANLDMAILYTEANPGFITSDSPCVWIDPNSHTRPSLYQGPALKYETIEITLPVSPTECIFLNRLGITGYLQVPDHVVNDLNKRVRFHASEYYVVNRNFVDDFWFYPGREPEDSWERQQPRKYGDD